jgi:Subtilase family
VPFPRLAPAALATALVLAGSAPAAAAPPRPPLLLPGDASASSVPADRATWLVGARPGARADAMAARHGARRLVPGVYVVARGRARELAGALRARRLLTFAEPNRRARRMQAPPATAPDPLSAGAGWRNLVVDQALAPPPVTPASPLLALVDAELDGGHPEFAGGNVSTLGGLPLTDAHGTETAAIAAAPKNDVGILGVWPGMRAVNVPLPGEILCADTVAGIGRAVDAGAAVINMSYGAPNFCFAEYAQLQLATAKGITLVAAAGNEFGQGNPLEFPASLPHVLTVAAVRSDLRSAYFSNANAAIDLSAPGVDILTATPSQFDADGNQDGYEAVTGTSFSAPMVAAAAAWVRAVRPQLSVDQVAQVLRLSARDLDRRGWDPATGFGLLSVGAALARRAPAADPLEPNDDIVWIDGRALGRPRPAIWSGGRPRRLRALLDQFEDPADVYRVRFPPRARLRVSVLQRFGDADVAAFTRSASSTADDEQLIGRSRHRGHRKDTLTLVNPSRRPRLAYIEVYIDRDASGLDAGYELSVRRAPR